jgi:hypothetical protein
MENYLKKLLKTSEPRIFLVDSTYAEEKTRQLVAANKAAAASILKRLQAEITQSLDSQVSSIKIQSGRISYDK